MLHTLNRQISAKAAVVYAYLLDLCGGSGVAWPSVRTIAASCAISRGAAERAVAELCAAKMLRVQRQGHGGRATNRYQCAATSSEISVPPAGHCVTPVGQIQTEHSERTPPLTPPAGGGRGPALRSPDLQAPAGAPSASGEAGAAIPPGAPDGGDRTDGGGSRTVAGDGRRLAARLGGRCSLPADLPRGRPRVDEVRQEQACAAGSATASTPAGAAPERQEAAARPGNRTGRPSGGMTEDGRRRAASMADLRRLCLERLRQDSEKAGSVDGDGRTGGYRGPGGLPGGSSSSGDGDGSCVGAEFSAMCHVEQRSGVDGEARRPLTHQDPPGRGAGEESGTRFNSGRRAGELFHAGRPTGPRIKKPRAPSRRSRTSGRRSGAGRDPTPRDWRSTLPPQLTGLASILAEWIQHRRELGKPITPTGWTATLREVERLGPSRAAAAITAAIAGGYLGFSGSAGGAGPGRHEAGMLAYEVPAVQRTPTEMAELRAWHEQWRAKARRTA